MPADPLPLLDRVLDVVATPRQPLRLVLLMRPRTRQPQQIEELSEQAAGAVDLDDHVGALGDLDVAAGIAIEALVDDVEPGTEVDEMHVGRDGLHAVEAAPHLGLYRVRPDRAPQHVAARPGHGRRRRGRRV